MMKSRVGMALLQAIAAPGEVGSSCGRLDTLRARWSMRAPVSIGACLLLPNDLVCRPAIWPERTFPRLKKALTFLLPDGWRGEVVDLSAAGMRIQSVVVLQPKTEVEGSLVLEDGSTIPLKGMVVWATPPDHRAFVLAEVGIELQSVPDVYLQALTKLFAEEPG